MRTSEEIYHRVRWDARFDPARFVLGVAQRGTEPKRIPFTSFVPGGDVPWHRVLFIEADGEVVWDRASGVDRIDATDAGRVREPRRLRPPFFESRPVPESPGRTTSSDLRVLTWNTLWDRYDPHLLDTARRRLLLLDALRAADADVIALQEVQSPLYDLLRDADWPGAGYALVPGRREADEYGLLLLSRLPVREAGLHVLGPHKAVAAIVVETGAAPVTVAVTHLTSDHSPEGPALRASQLAALAEGFGSVAGDLVLMGDFNDATDTPEKALSLQDVSPDGPPTFDPSTNPLAALSSTTGRPGRLDRVLLRGACRPVRTDLLGVAPVDGLFVSDHFGVAATLARAESSTAAESRERRGPLQPQAPADLRDQSRTARAQLAAAFPEGALHLAGSRRMRCELPGADLDLVLALPGAVAVEDVRDRVRAALPDAVRLRAVTRARTDGVKFSFQGLDVDLAVVATGDVPPAEAVPRRTELPPPAAIALSAVSDADAVLTLVGTARHDAFARLTRRVKAWARVRGLDSAPFGGLPGLGWAVLTARTVHSADPDPDAALSDDALLRDFFATWAAHDWDTFELLTPTAPIRPLTDGIGPSGRDLIARELYDAWETVDAAHSSNTAPEPQLLTAPPLTDRHAAWAVITVPTPDDALIGRVRGRMRALITHLEDAGLNGIQGWPHPHGTTPLHFTVGLGPHRPDIRQFTEATSDWARGLRGVTVTMERSVPRWRSPSLEP
ncbi:RNA repair domain-containing protein [Streptomyces sp. NPDC047315]|uniref:RNA repair domain-containing protein n=1 Tax=Streptomyces sp. NPDC047315 TaxID=3155142 RepID=UPI0033CD7C4D